MDSNDIHARYTADGGGFIPGVPARDLTRDEWLALDKETRDLCRSTGLYALVAKADAPKAITAQKDTTNG